MFVRAASAITGTSYPVRRGCSRLKSLVANNLFQRTLFPGHSLSHRRFSHGFGRTFLPSFDQPSVKDEVHYEPLTGFPITDKELLSRLNIDSSYVDRVERGGIDYKVIFKSSHASEPDFLYQVELLIKYLARNKINASYASSSNSLIVSRIRDTVIYF